MEASPLEQFVNMFSSRLNEAAKQVQSEQAEPENESIDVKEYSEPVSNDNGSEVKEAPAVTTVQPAERSKRTAKPPKRLTEDFDCDLPAHVSKKALLTSDNTNTTEKEQSDATTSNEATPKKTRQRKKPDDDTEAGEWASKFDGKTAYFMVHCDDQVKAISVDPKTRRLQAYRTINNDGQPNATVDELFKVIKVGNRIAIQSLVDNTYVGSDPHLERKIRIGRNNARSWEWFSLIKAKTVDGTDHFHLYTHHNAYWTLDQDGFIIQSTDIPKCTFVITPQA
jgi:sugar-specific transcriptional regulator TrmB